MLHNPALFQNRQLLSKKFLKGILRILGFFYVKKLREMKLWVAMKGDEKACIL
jgi:hypothetical protein